MSYCCNSSHHVSYNGIFKVEKATQAKSRLPEEGSAVQEEEEESKYTVVQTSLSVPRPSLPDNSTVQYQEIDIRTTHVS